MKRAFTLIEALILLALVALVAIIIWPIIAKRNFGAPRAQCQSHLKQIGLGFMQYVQDYNQKMPPARLTASKGWADGLRPYLKSSEQLFQCPSTQSKTTPFVSDYFYNRRLARVSQEQLPSPARTIMGGEGDDNAPTWNSWMGLTFGDVADVHSPAFRHMDNGNYLFADGHVKALKPTAISSASSVASSAQATFAIQ